MNLYVNGFMYSADESKVVLIKKNTPQWQKGFFNGIGGRIEQGESPKQAIIREFEEETGVKTVENDWQLFAIITNKLQYKVYFFVAFTDKMLSARTVETEEVGIYDVNHLPTRLFSKRFSYLSPNLFGTTPFFSSFQDFIYITFLLSFCHIFFIGYFKALSLPKISPLLIDFGRPVKSASAQSALRRLSPDYSGRGLSSNCSPSQVFFRRAWRANSLN